MDDAKYVVVMENGTESVIIFPCWMYHKNIADGRRVISAGNVWFDNCKDAVGCYGKSTSLNICSRPEEDAQLIKTSILKQTNEETNMPANRLKDRYNGECPVCGDEMDDNVREGDECSTCGEIFEMCSEPDIEECDIPEDTP